MKNPKMAKKSYQVQTRQIEQITNHPDYTKGKDDNNLALVELKTPVKLSKGLVDSVKLPSCSNMRDGRKSKGRAVSSASQKAGPFIPTSIKFPGQTTFIDLSKVNKKGGQQNISGTKKRQHSKGRKKGKGTKTKRLKGKNQKKSRKGQRNGGYYPNVFSRDSYQMPSHMGSMSQWGSPMHYAAIPL